MCWWCGVESSSGFSLLLGYSIVYHKVFLTDDGMQGNDLAVFESQSKALVIILIAGAFLVGLVVVFELNMAELLD